MIQKIVTNIQELRKPCLEITKEDDVKSIIQDLKDTLESKKGIGISANQIGVQKRISYIKIPQSINQRTKKVDYKELILINAKIIEHNRPIQIKNESCLSFPGVYVNTRRYVFITVEFYNEKMELQTGLMQDLESLVVQHEWSHQQGKTMFDFKWRAK